MLKTIKHRSGFLLLEIVCALALLACVIHVITSSYAQLLFSHRHIVLYNRALLLARNAIEEVRMKNQQEGRKVKDNYVIDVILKKEKHIPFTHIMITVSWKERVYLQRSFTLCAGMITDV